MAAASTTAGKDTKEPDVKKEEKYSVWSVYPSYVVVYEAGEEVPVALGSGKTVMKKTPPKYLQFTGSHYLATKAELEYIKSIPWYGTGSGCISADDWVEMADGKDERFAEGFARELLRRSQTGVVPYKNEMRVAEMIRKSSTEGKAAAKAKAEAVKPGK